MSALDRELSSDTLFASEGLLDQKIVMKKISQSDSKYEVELSSQSEARHLTGR